MKKAAIVAIVDSNERINEAKKVAAFEITKLIHGEEEAILQMNLIGHMFYMFRNAETDNVCVVYRRNDGGYGLIEPDFE